MKTLFRLAPVLTVCALSATAFAYDWKTMPGSACTPAGTLSNGTIAPFAVTIEGYVYFLGGGASSVGYFTCPMQRDSVRGTIGLADVGVRVIDTSTTGDMTCTLSSTTFNGNLVVSRTASSGDAYAGGYTQLAFPMNMSASNGSYSLVCVGDPGVKIVSYGYAEFDEQP